MQAIINRNTTFPASLAYEKACADHSTAHCPSLAECAGELPLLIADAYLMGGEL